MSNYRVSTTRVHGVSTRKPKHWSEEAACKGIDVNTFFPNETDDGKQMQFGPVASAVCTMCADCPVKLHCRLAGYAEEYGVFGNTSVDYRGKTRAAIFARVTNPFRSNVDGGYDNFRDWVNRVLQKRGTLTQKLRAAGLNDREISIFVSPSPYDIKASKVFSKQTRNKYLTAREAVSPKDWATCEEWDVENTEG